MEVRLADNFVTDDTFKNYASQVFPSIENKINQRGVFLDENGNSKNSRLSLQPHLKYYSYEHLRTFAKKCIDDNTEQQDIIACLTHDDKQTKTENK